MTQIEARLIRAAGLRPAIALFAALKTNKRTPIAHNLFVLLLCLQTAFCSAQKVAYFWRFDRVLRAAKVAPRFVVGCLALNCFVALYLRLCLDGARTIGANAIRRNVNKRQTKLQRASTQIRVVAQQRRRLLTLGLSSGFEARLSFIDAIAVRSASRSQIRALICS